MKDLDLSTGDYKIILGYDHSRAIYGHERGIPYVVDIWKEGQHRYEKSVRIAEEFLEEHKHYIRDVIIEDYERALPHLQ